MAGARGIVKYKGVIVLLQRYLHSIPDEMLRIAFQCPIVTFLLPTFVVIDDLW